MDINENQVTSEKGKETNSPILDVSDDESELPWAMYRSLDPAYKKNEAEESEHWALGDEEDITGNTSCCVCHGITVNQNVMYTKKVNNDEGGGGGGGEDREVIFFSNVMLYFILRPRKRKEPS